MHAMDSVFTKQLYKNCKRGSSLKWNSAIASQLSKVSHSQIKKKCCVSCYMKLTQSAIDSLSFLVAFLADHCREPTQDII